MNSRFARFGAAAVETIILFIAGWYVISGGLADEEEVIVSKTSSPSIYPKLSPPGSF